MWNSYNSIIATQAEHLSKCLSLVDDTPMLSGSTVVTVQEGPGVFVAVLLVAESVRNRCDTLPQYPAVVPSVLGSEEVLLEVGSLEWSRNQSLQPPEKVS